MQTSGALNAAVSQLFQRLDSNQNGLSLEELQSLDQNQDGEIQVSESESLSFLSPEDIGLLNSTLAQARSSGLKPADILFPDKAYQPQSEVIAYVSGPEPAIAAESEQTLRFPTPVPKTPSSVVDVLQQQNDNPYDFSNPDVMAKALKLRAAGTTYEANAMNPKNYLILRNLDSGFSIDPSQPNRLPSIGTLPLNTFYSGGTPRVTDGASLRKEALDYFRNQLTAASGGTVPSDADVKTYIKGMGDLLMLQFGADGNANYTHSATTGASKLAGSSTHYSGFRPPSTVDAYVCNDIHGAISGFRQNLMGQESFVASSSGPDGAHLFTIYKEGENWNIQNYGTIIQTKAKSIQELYENYIPDNNVMRLYEVTEGGDLRLAANELTEAGVHNRLFRTQTGAQGLFSDDEFFEIGTNGIRGSQGAISGALDIQRQAAALQISDKQQIDPNTVRHLGAVVQGDLDLNAAGLQSAAVDGKVEAEFVTSEKVLPDVVTDTRGYSSVELGGKIERSPLYGIGFDPIVSQWWLGANVSYETHQVYGEDDLKGLAGFNTVLGTRVTMPAGGSGQLYAGKSLYDTLAEFKTVLGLQYEQGDALQARAGISMGPELQNFYSLTDFGALLEADLFGEAKIQEGPMTVNALMTANIKRPGVFQVSGQALYNPLPNLAFNTAFTYLNDPSLGNRGSIHLGGAWQPLPNLTTMGSMGILNDGSFDAEINVRQGF